MCEAVLLASLSQMHIFIIRNIALASFGAVLLVFVALATSCVAVQHGSLPTYIGVMLSFLP